MRTYLAITLCLTFYGGFNYAQTSLEEILDSLQIEHQKVIQEINQTNSKKINIERAIRSVEDQIMKQRISSGHLVFTAKIKSDACRLVDSNLYLAPKRGTQVSIIGFDASNGRNGSFIIQYKNFVGPVSNSCLEFDDSAYRIKQAYLDEAKLLERRKQVKIDSIEAIKQTKIDSVESIAQARIDSLRAIEKVKKDSLRAVEMADLQTRLDSIRAATISKEQRITTRLDSIGQTNFPFIVNGVWVRGINSSDGVDLQVQAQYLKKSKTIKYLYFTVQPYNAVGDLVKCNIRDYSTFTGKITGPIIASYKDKFWNWEAAWYNNTVDCLKLIKVKVEYMDGTAYTYVKELPQILGDYNNDCSVK